MLRTGTAVRHLSIIDLLELTRCEGAKSRRTFTGGVSPTGDKCYCKTQAAIRASTTPEFIYI
jgi:hypothetical protein